MKDISNTQVFKKSMWYTTMFVGVLWLIKAYELTFGADLGYLGIFPLTLKGTIGIFTSPLIHGDPLHLLSNTFPLILLGVGLFYFYHKIAKRVFLWIYILTGVGVWIIAREAYHIGASGIIYGILSFLFFIGLFNKDNKSMVISLIILFLYGGMVAGLFPSDNKISYESHIMGAFAGLIVAFMYRNQGMEGSVKDEDDQEKQENQDVPHYSQPDHTHSSPQISFKIQYKEHKKS